LRFTTGPHDALEGGLDSAAVLEEASICHASGLLEAEELLAGLLLR
jgi:hypothetical protein